VFADFYLFETLLGLKGDNLDAQARHYLERLHLNHKVKINQGGLSTTALSQGQRKRLALLTAYLEDRPFTSSMSGLPIRIRNSRISSTPKY